MNSSVKTVYKIRHKPTGLFSTGGTDPQFTSKGKVWSTIGHLKNHLNLATENYYNPKWVGMRTEFKKYSESEIVTYQMVSEEQPPPFDMMVYFTEKIEKQVDLKLIRYRDYPSAYKLHFPIQVVYPDGTRKVIDPLDSINDNASND